MVGSVLGHYGIVEKIGEGGMGVVYRAHDESLEREVAIKVLPAGTLTDETARKRFRKEALALAKLNHPNIEAVHEFATQGSTDYLVMEYIPGVTLSDKLSAGPLPEKEILRLGAQLAEGLAAAHEQNIVHRDLKPGNLRITPEGRLKILDFGLAKLVHPFSDSGPTASVTESHVVQGTLPYMAPEQLRGDPVDARTDLYAAGNVLYEMATGHRPFEAKLATILTDNILHKAAPPPSSLNGKISPAVDNIILKALEKEPERRFQSARDLLADFLRVSAPSGAVIGVRPRRRILPWALGASAALVAVLAILFGLNVGGVRDRVLTGTRGREIRSIAVLPLENLSGDQSQEWFADGMTEALTTELSKIGALRVISRTSVMQYKRVRKPLAQIAIELNVDAVVEGSVLRVGDRVRITAQLIGAVPERHLWANSYDRELRDVLAVLSEVAQAIAGEVHVTLTPQERARLATARPVHPEAYQLYLQGRFFSTEATAPALEKSIEYLQRAIEKDPNFAAAYASLAEAYGLHGQMAALPQAEYFLQAKKAAQKALEIDDTMGEAHASLGQIKSDQEWDWEGAEREYKRAIALSPNYANAYLWYSQLLNVLGRHEEALAKIKRAQELAPLDSFVSANVLWRLWLAGHSDQALAESKKLLEMYPNYWLIYWTRGSILSAKGMYREAITDQQKAVDLSQRSLECLPDLAYAYARAGRRAEALKVLGRLEAESRKRYVPSFFFAVVYSGLGEKDRAFERLERAYQEHDSRLPWIAIESTFDSLHSDPRFQDLRRRMNLPL